MDTMSGCSAFLGVLQSEGVEYLFGNPGTTELPIMDGLVDRADLKYVLGLQEAVVMGMADGYCRASGKLCCVNFHVAPGLGNAIGAIYNANFFGSPVIVTAGQQERALCVTEPMLYHELVSMARPVVKWATEVQRPEDIPRVFRRAAKVALTPPTGPVFVSLPGDVLKGTGTMALGSATRVDSRSRPREGALIALADCLLASDRPVIIAGHEVYTSDAMAELAAVADLLGAPVYSPSVSYVAVFPTAHPLFMGEITRHQPTVRKTLDPHDLLFMVGGDGLRMSVPSAVEPVPPHMTIVQVGNRDWELGKNYPVKIALDADVKETLGALVPVLKARRTAEQENGARQRSAGYQDRNWSAKRSELIAGTAPQVSERPITPDYLMMTLSQHLPEEAVVVEEGISSVRHLLGFLSVSHRYRLFGLASGGIGCGIAAAVGIKLALPNRPVVGIIGDGSAMYSIQALWTAAHQKLQVIYVIVDNGGYSILKQRLLAYGGAAAASGRTIGMSLCEPPIDFVGLAAALGVSARQVVEPDQIAPALADALAHDGPTLLDVKVRDISRD